MPINLPKRVLQEFGIEIVAEAMATCRGDETGDVTRPRIARLRAAIAVQRGELPLAIAYLAHAIGLAPLDASAWRELGDALHRTGRSKEALVATLRAITIEPGADDGFCRLAVVLTSQKRFSEALLAGSESVRLSPDEPENHAVLGDIHRARGCLREAESEYEIAVRLQPEHAEWHARIGDTKLQSRQPELALASFERGLALQPNNAQLQIGRGQALLRIGAIDRAADAFHQAVSLAPNDVSASRRYLIALELLGRQEAMTGAWASLGFALEQQGDPQAAAFALAKGLERKPDNLRAAVALARCLVDLGQKPQAIEAYKRAIAINPVRANTHVAFGLALQRFGEWDAGWSELAHHHATNGTEWLNVEQPVWDGAALLGRTILLWAIAPASEVVQFIRYARFAKSRGGTVIVECDRTLLPLMRDTDGVDTVMAAGAPRPPFDVHAPLRYLPALVGPARKIPLNDAGCYFMCDAAGGSQGSQAEAPPGNVGLVWATCPEDPECPSDNVPLSALMQLAQVPGVRLSSLQRGRHRDQLLAYPSRTAIHDLLAEESSLRDVVASIHRVSLVISVDSVVAHAAAAMGAEVWLLLRKGAGWPWPVNGIRTPWYPTIRMFRQSVAGDWSDVLEALVRALQERMNGDFAETTSLVETFAVQPPPCRS